MDLIDTVLANPDRGHALWHAKHHPREESENKNDQVKPCVHITSTRGEEFLKSYGDSRLGLQEY